MKKLMITLWGLCLGLSSGAMAETGGVDIGNGGDGYAVEFVAMGKSLLKHWDEIQVEAAIGMKKEDFERALKSTQTHSTTETLWVDGYEVDAKNYPFCTPVEAAADRGRKCGVILLNRGRWDGLKSDLVKRAALVLHEYLGVLGLNKQRFDDFYEASGAAFDRIRAILDRQLRVLTNFSCWVEAWDKEKNSTAVLQTLDTYTTDSPRKLLEVPGKDGPRRYWIELSKVSGDFLASARVDRLYYALYAFVQYALPEKKDLLSTAEVRYGATGRKSLRILNGPELQLTCFRTFDGIGQNSSPVSF